jgi:hypothetical protein
MASCAGAGGASLGYALPSAPEVRYVIGDTLMLSLEGLGQEMEIGARSRATYDVRYGSASDNLRVTASIQSLTADVVTPMTEPMAMDEGMIEGDFVFELDRRGRVVSMSSPQASGGGQVFAAPIVAHALFPRLPDRAVASGASWVDSVTYTEATEAGETSVQSSFTYTVLGDARARGRNVLEIDVGGTAAVTQALSFEGANITQSSNVEVVGRLWWDTAAGLLEELEMTMEGPGTVRVALFPAALPTSVRWLVRVRREER